MSIVFMKGKVLESRKWPTAMLPGALRTDNNNS